MVVERHFVEAKKEEFKVKEFIFERLGKGKVTDVRIEKTPVGERITIHTTKPGLVIGKKGELLSELTEELKTHFKTFENPRLEIAEVPVPELNAKAMADDIAIALERAGILRFKAIAYKALERIKAAGSPGAEIVLSGKLPAEKAKTWRFTYGVLKKTGELRFKVDRAKSVAFTVPGVVGVKVAIVPKGVTF